MIVLALDTSGPGGSCALVRDGQTLEAAGDRDTPHAARLPRDLMAVLDRAGVPLTAVDVFAVATGPGSFTGLRVGIATMQGLAFAQDAPLVGVSSFDALADIALPQAGLSLPVAVWIDAWRGEVYTALYVGGEPIEAPRVETPDAALARIGAQPALFVGDGAALHESRIRAARPDARVAVPVAPLLAGAVARRAAAAVEAGERPAPDVIRPVYVRRSDAEIARDARAAR